MLLGYYWNKFLSFPRLTAPHCTTLHCTAVLTAHLAALSSTVHRSDPSFFKCCSFQRCSHQESPLQQRSSAQPTRAPRVHNLSLLESLFSLANPH